MTDASRPGSQIPEAIYQAIADDISSDTSPVGIDAKKTHILILHQLAQIAERLERIEKALEGRG